MVDQSKVEKNRLSVEEKERLTRKMDEVKEKEGTDGLKRFILNEMLDMEDKRTGGDDFLFWTEENAIDSTQRINALDAKLCTFHSECGKLVVEWCVNNGFPQAQAGLCALLAQLGVFSDECQVLHAEFAKSAAEFIIKKMRLGALVGKRDKKTTLLSEIVLARELWKKYGDAFTLFKENLSQARKVLQLEQQLQQLLQDPHAHVIVQENDVGDAPVECPETARGKIKNLESALSNEKLVSPNVKAFNRERFRVVVELMRGVGQQPVEVSYDDAMILGNKWMEAEMGLCVMKVWVGTVVLRRSVFEVLKSEIAENWEMEKEVNDRIVDYQREHHARRLSQGGFVAEVEGEETVQEKKTEGGGVVEGGETIEEKNRGVSTVVEGDETRIEGTLGEWVVLV